MKARQLQALLAGAIIATVLLFLATQHLRSHGFPSGRGEFSEDSASTFDDNQGAVSDVHAQSQTGPAATLPRRDLNVPRRSSLQEWDSAWDDKTLWPEEPGTAVAKSANESAHWASATNHILPDEVEEILGSIWREEDGDNSTSKAGHLTCPLQRGSRYNLLRDKAAGSGQVQFFFALNLHQSIDVIPRLMGSVLETVRFLGPEHCAISIVDGRSDDGTYEVVAALRPRVESMGAQFYLSTTRSRAKDEDLQRAERLSAMRNKVLEPLREVTSTGPVRGLSGTFSPDTVAVILDAIALCPEDILELILQHVHQGARMSCAVDWIWNETLVSNSRDVRSLDGTPIFDISRGSSISRVEDVFFQNHTNRHRYEASLPVQVYSCWGGMVVLDALPFAEDWIKFRLAASGECATSEAMLLARDLYQRRGGRIMAVPAINVAHSNKDAAEIKQLRGYVQDHVHMFQPALDNQETIGWQRAPPAMVKCLSSQDDPRWMKMQDTIRTQTRGE